MSYVVMAFVSATSGKQSNEDGFFSVLSIRFQRESRSITFFLLPMNSYI